MMIIISNTSPVINLAMIGQIQLLQTIYRRIIIPEAVYHEIVIDGAGQPGAREVETESWIQKDKINNTALVKSLQGELDAGEAEAIALAIEKNANLLLIDERIGRRIAARFGVKFIGVLGIIIHAKQKGHIEFVKPLMDRLIVDAGFWINISLYENILSIAGEAKL